MDKTPVVLVGTDFGAESDRAFAKACEIAHALNATVHLIHVVEPVDELNSTDDDTLKFYSAVSMLSELKLEAELRHNQRPVNVSSEVKVGQRARTLQQSAEELGAELVVLGHRPRAAESTERLGVSHAVALASARPVLLVP